MLRLRSALRAGEDVPAPRSLRGLEDSELARGGVAPLFTVDGPLRLAAIRSLVMPPTCPWLGFAPPEPLPPAEGPAFDLRADPARHWRQVLEARQDRSWWVAAYPERLPRLKERLAAVVDLEPRIRALLAEHFGEAAAASLRALALTGSYLWEERPGPDVDVIAHVDLGPRHLPHGMEHWQGACPAPPPTAEGCELPTVDLLLVATRLLSHPEGARGRIGEWREHPERVLPYDLRRRTVLAAIRQTLAAAIPIHGPDLHAAVEQRAPDLLALSRYFLQEASVLLDERSLAAKAAQRVHEALLILQFLERRDSTGEAQPLRDLTADAARAVRALRDAPADPELLASLQGWWGREPEGLLDRACRALAVAAQRRGLTGPDNGSRPARAMVRRARWLREPGWQLLRSRLAALGAADRVLDLSAALDEGAESTRDRPGYATFEPSARTGDEARRGDLDEALEGLLTVAAGDDEPHADRVASAIQLERRVELRAISSILLGDVPLGYWLGDLFSPGSSR